MITLKTGGIHKSWSDDNNTWYLLIRRVADMQGKYYWICATFNHITKVKGETQIYEQMIDTRKNHIPDSVFDTFEERINQELQTWKAVMSGFLKTESKN